MERAAVWTCPVIVPGDCARLGTGHNRPPASPVVQFLPLQQCSSIDRSITSSTAQRIESPTLERPVHDDGRSALFPHTTSIPAMSSRDILSWPRVRRAAAILGWGRGFDSSLKGARSKLADGRNGGPDLTRRIRSGNRPTSAVPQSLHEMRSFHVVRTRDSPHDAPPTPRWSPRPPDRAWPTSGWSVSAGPLPRPRRCP